MQKACKFMCLLGVLAVLLGAGEARAQSMNLSLARLRLSQSSGACGAAPSSGTRLYCADNNAWRSLAQQFGAVLMAPALTPASTGGPDSYYIGLDGTMTGIAGSADYWQLGTAGDAQAETEGRNRDPGSLMYMQRVTVRKGLPFGFEVGSSLGYLVGTSYVTLGADVKFAIFEGFHRDWGAYVPDIALRGSVQVLLGENEASFTVPSLDIIASKTFSVAGMGTITPILGAQMAWIIARSEVIDLTPDVDAYAQQRDTGAVDDFNNNAIFPNVNAFRTRGFLGLQGRYRALTLAGTVMFDLGEPDDAGASTPLDLQRQWSFSLAAGVTLQ